MLILYRIKTGFFRTNRILHFLILVLFNISICTAAAAISDQGEIEISVRPGVMTDNSAAQEIHVIDVVRSVDDLQRVLDKLGKTITGNSTIIINFGPGIYRITKGLTIDGNLLRGISVEIRGRGKTLTQVVGSVTYGPAAQFDFPAKDLRLYKTYSFGFGYPTVPHPVLFWAENARIVPGRWPKQGWGYIQSIKEKGDKWYLKLVDGRRQNAQLKSGPVRLSGFLGNDWAYESIPAFVHASDEIEVEPSLLRYGAKVGMRATLENARGENTDGRITLNPATGRLQSHLPIEMPAAEYFLNVNNASNVIVTGFAFSGYRGDAIIIRSSKHISINNNYFNRIGNRAIYAVTSAAVNIADNNIQETGEGAVYIEGGDRSNLRRSGNSVVNNQIDHFSEVSLTYRPAIYTKGFGSSILNNTLSYGPHSAIIFEGGEHRISHNFIFSVAQEVRDSGAILSWRDWATYGTVIDNNILFDIIGRKDLPQNDASNTTNGVRGIYLDDFVSGITIQNNVFYNVEYAIFLNGGSDNTIRSNTFINCSPAIVFNAWGLSQPRSKFNNAHRAVKILTQLQSEHSPLLDKYPRLRNSIDDLLTPHGNAWDNNILINSGGPQIYNKAKSGGLMHFSRDVVLSAPVTNFFGDPRIMKDPPRALQKKIKELLDNSHASPDNTK